MLTLLLVSLSVCTSAARAGETPVPTPSVGYAPAPPSLSALGLAVPGGVTTPQPNSDSTISQPDSLNSPNPANPMLDYNAAPPSAGHAGKPGVRVNGAATSGGGGGVINGTVGHF